MDLFLEGKTTVVTGGTRGIGFAIARTLLGHGARVAICGSNDETVRNAVTQLKTQSSSNVLAQTCDVRSREAVRNFFGLVDREFGGPDIVINNAGIGVFAPVAELAVEDWNRVLDTNLTGVFHCSQEALVRFRQRGGGYLIHIGSLAGRNPFAGGGVYNASKFGLIGFAEATMLDHRHDNVRVSTILPGSVNTEFSPRSKPAAWKIAPEDIADIVVSLLRMPERTLVSLVEVRPSKPPKP
jgi:NAD(P)-dependent dehydrogenase (short-subunit alcohol dehydrogenase family)